MNTQDCCLTVCKNYCRCLFFFLLISSLRKYARIHTPISMSEIAQRKKCNSYLNSGINCYISLSFLCTFYFPVIVLLLLFSCFIKTYSKGHRHFHSKYILLYSFFLFICKKSIRTKSFPGQNMKCPHHSRRKLCLDIFNSKKECRF